MAVKGLLGRLHEIDAEHFLSKLHETKQILGDHLRRYNGYLLNIEASARLTISGDLHGDLEALVEILRLSGFPSSKEHRLIFLGDYGDRGSNQVEVYYVLLSLKCLYPDQVYLLRGNHEAPEEIPFSPYDLPEQLRFAFADKADEIEGSMKEFFKLLPIAALVDRKYLLLHGGAPSQVREIDDIRNAPSNHPQAPHLTEILWNDPSDQVDDVRPNLQRGIGMEFGRSVSQRILELVDAKVIVRGHEARPAGINHAGLLLTVFSAKGPYSLPYGAYLDIRGTEELLDGYALQKALVRF